MTSRIRTLFMVGALAALTGVNGVAADAVAIKAKVPFEFSVGNTQVAAGEYLVTRDMARSVIRITSVDTGRALSVVIQPAGKSPTTLRYALVFHKYGDQHFLREIWTGDPQFGYRMPMSRAEKEQMSAHTPTKTTIGANSAL